MTNKTICYLLILFGIFNINAQITSYPYIEDFENGAAGWTVEVPNTSPVTSWQLGSPENSIINYAASGTNAWVTNLTGDYFFDENGWVQSPVFDFSSITKPIISLYVFWNCEYIYDGAVIQSSIDSGTTWQNIGVYGTDPNWFTYGNILSSPGGQGEGWSGTLEDSWGSGYYYNLSRELLGLEGQSNVIIRFVFASDNYINDEGVAFDLVKIRDCYAGEDNNLFTCVNSSSGLLNLNSLLDENAGLDGTWMSNNSLAILENNQVDLSQITSTALYNFTYTVSDGNGCFDQALIGINAQLTPNAGEDNSATICGGISQIDLNEYLSSDADFDGTWTALDELQIDEEHIISASSIISSGTFSFEYSVTSPNCGNDSSVITLTIEKVLSAGDNSTYDCSTLASTDELFSALEGNPDPGGRWEPNESDVSFGNAGTYRYIHDATSNCLETSAEVVFTASLPDAGGNNEYFVEITDDDGAKNLDEILSQFGKNSISNQNKISRRWIFSSGPRTVTADDASDVDFPNTGAGPDQAYIFIYTLENDCGEEDSAVITINISGWNPTHEEGAVEICEGQAATKDDLFDSLTKEGLRELDSNWKDENGQIVSFPVTAGTYYYEDFGSNTATVIVTILPSEPAAFNGGNFSYNTNCISISKTDFFDIMGITDESEKTGVFYYCDKTSGICNYEDEVDFTNPVGDSKYSYALVNAGECISNFAEITVTGYPIANAGEEPLEPIFIDYNQFVDSEGISDLDDILCSYRNCNSNKFNSKKLVAQSSWRFKSGQRTITVDNDGSVDFPNTGAGLPWLYEFEYTVTDTACGGTSDTIIVAVDVQGFEMNQEASLTICSGTDITDALLNGALSPDLNWNEDGAVWTQNSENPNIYNGIDFLENTATVTVTEITPELPNAGPDRAYYLIWGQYNLNDVLTLAEAGKNPDIFAKVSRRWSFLSGTRPAATDDDGNIDFPNTGAGGEEDFTFIYTLENECGETDEATITFYINDNNSFMYDTTICEGDTLTKQDLFDLIGDIEGNIGQIRYFNGDFTDLFTEEPITFPVSEGNYWYSDWTGNTALFDVFRANTLNAKVFLQGALLNPSAGEEHLMRDDLRALGHIPTTSPYDDTTCDPEVFEAVGDDAIVDWVFIEFRRGEIIYNYAVLDTRSALLQRDGDIVGVDGITPLCLIDIGPFYCCTSFQRMKVTIKHRNHLGVMSTSDIFVGRQEEDAFIDFTDANNLITFGTNAQGSFSMPTGALGMWAGDADGDGNIGFANDGNQTLFDVLFHPSNVTYSSSFSFANGYFDSDINLDGVVSFQDDLNNVLTNVIFYPDNTTYSSSFGLFNEQLPIDASAKANKEKLAKENQEYIKSKINEIQK